MRQLYVRYVLHLSPAVAVTTSLESVISVSDNELDVNATRVSKSSWDYQLCPDSLRLAVHWQ